MKTKTIKTHALSLLKERLATTPTSAPREHMLSKAHGFAIA